MGIFVGMQLENFTISAEILKLIAEIDEFKGAWRALGTLAPEKLSALRRVATIESIGSSTRIEGSKLTDQEVEQLLSNLQIKSFGSRDEQEVAGYAEVMELVFQNWDNIPVTENHIKQLHRDLLKYSDKDIRHRGEYKKLNNNVEAFDAEGKHIGIVFQTASPFDTPRLMEELLEWVAQAFEEKRYHPLLVIAVFIVVFLEIHPFQDGNGRLSRVLTSLLLLKAGYLYVPYASLESVVEQNKEAYYLALRRTQGTIRTDKPDWNPWITFFLFTLQKQKQNLYTKIERENLMQKTLPELSLDILRLVKEHGQITIGSIVTVTGANRNTVKRHLQVLVNSGYLIKQGERKGAWYIRA